MTLEVVHTALLALRRASLAAEVGVPGEESKGSRGTSQTTTSASSFEELAATIAPLGATRIYETSSAERWTSTPAIMVPDQPGNSLGELSKHK